MSLFAIIETEAGLTVAETKPSERPEDAAVRLGGVVVDPGPYRSYDEAYDALLAVRYDEEEDELAG